MTSIRRSRLTLQVRSYTGTVREPLACFSSGFLMTSGDAMTPVEDETVISAALAIVAARLRRSSPLTHPQLTQQFFALRFAGLEHEVFACLYLDHRMRPIACEDLFRGTIDGAEVHSREVVKQALVHNAAAVILAHNHPSGFAEPSQPDEQVTRLLKQALALVGVRVLDHLVIGGASCVSFKERGLL